VRRADICVPQDLLNAENNTVPCLIETPSLSQPLPSLVAFVKRQIRNAEAYAGPERRAELRRSIVMPVIAQPIDEEFRAIGGPLAMVTRDISPKGIGLVQEERLIYDRLAIRLAFSEEVAVLVGEVRWRKPVGPFYSCGCEVIAKLENMPE